jgi:hypothetical protein
MATKREPQWLSFLLRGIRYCATKVAELAEDVEADSVVPEFSVARSAS